MEITTELNDGVALIRMDDGKMNAMTPVALDGVASALAAATVQADAIVLAGRPGSFCAGFDRAVMTGSDDDAKAVLGRGGARIAHALLTCTKPVVAASTGHAFTVGALWLMACDLRFGERGEFKYAMTETIMGAALSGWPMALLESRVPAHLMTPIAVLSQMRGPEDAVDAGYIDQVVEAGTAEAAAVAAARELAKLPQAAFAGNKRSVRRATIERMEAELAKL